MRILTICWLLLVLITPKLHADEHLSNARLLIGFHEKDYISLNGAAEAVDYINEKWGDKQLISLVRPMGNSTILVELNEANATSLNKVIDQLLQMDKIRFVDRDQQVEFMPQPDIGIPTIN